MSTYVERPALICPYTLMEEEALAWSILLFDQALLLHPYPLQLPASVQSLMDRGMIQIRSLKQTPEAIREKDRILRGIKQYLLDNPGQGFLKYLMEAASLDDQETQEEITGLMKGRPFQKPLRESLIIEGPVLLCLIHEWMMQEWEVEISLAAVEEQEKNLIQGWQENPEEESIWKSADPLVLKRKEAEIYCPPALAAWRELKNTLVPEPSILFTTQPWVWAEYYSLDPEENRIHAIPLPDLSSLNNAIFNHTTTHRSIREKMEALLHSPQSLTSKTAIDDFQKAFLALELPPPGKYRLVFPPQFPSFPVPSSSSGQGNPDPMILLLPALT